jgi:hypothetical protein
MVDDEVAGGSDSDLVSVIAEALEIRATIE